MSNLINIQWRKVKLLNWIGMILEWKRFVLKLYNVVGKLDSILWSENFSTESLIVCSKLKDKSDIIRKGTFDFRIRCQNQTLTMKDLKAKDWWWKVWERLLQNGFASLDIIRGGRGGRCVGRGKCQKYCTVLTMK